MNYSLPFKFDNAKAHYIKDVDFKLTHFDLQLEFSDIASDFNVAGSLELSLLALDDNPAEIVLDCCEIDVIEVKSNNKNLRFTVLEKELILNTEDLAINAGDNIIISIKYNINSPRYGLNFINPSDENPDIIPQVWSQGESAYTKYWIPIFDTTHQICTNTKVIICPPAYEVYSNGLLTKTKKLENGKIAYTWTQDLLQPVYLNAVFIGGFEKHILTNHNLPFEIANIVSKRKSVNINSNQNLLLPEMIEHLQKLFGVDFPHQKYYQGWADEFLSGGMENSSLTINGSDYLLGNKAENDYDFAEHLIVHELTHQWFGDYLVINNWDELWIKEGGAVFGELAWNTYKYGEEKGDYYRYTKVMGGYFADTPRPTMLHFYDEEDDLYDSHSYNKAGLVYALIRKYLKTDKIFTSFIKTLLEDNKYKNIGYQEFVKAGIKATGKNFKPFVDQYLLRTGHPNFTVSTSWDQISKTFTVNIKQKQCIKDMELETLFILNNLELDIFFVENEDKNTGNNAEKPSVVKISKHVNVSKESNSFHFQLNKKPSFATLDSQFFFVFQQDYSYSNSELKDIITYHPSALAKINAIKKLCKTATKDTLLFLEKIYKSTDKQYLKCEILKGIKDFKLLHLFEVLKSWFNKNDEGFVLSALFRNIAELKSEDAYSFIKSNAVNYDHSYLAERSCYTYLGKVAAGINNIEIWKDAFNFLSDKFNVFDNVADEALKAELMVLKNGVIDGIAFLVEYEPAFEFILNLAEPAKKRYHSRARAILNLGKFAKFNNEKWITKILDSYLTVASQNINHFHRYLLAGIGIVNDYRVINVLDTLNNSSIHYRVTSRAREAKAEIISKLNANETNKKLFKKLEEKNTEIDTLKARVVDMEFKFEAFGKELEKISAGKSSNKDGDVEKDNK